MKYRINIFYKDGEQVNVHLEGDEIDTFFKNLNDREVYRHPKVDSGFWTNIEDVRYVLVFPEKEAEPEPEPKEEEDSE